MNTYSRKPGNAVLTALALIVLLAYPTQNGQTTDFPFQGRLELGGIGVSGSASMTFFAVTDPTQEIADAVWTSGILEVPTNDGNFSVLLQIDDLVILANQVLYLGVVVHTTDGQDIPLDGRQRITESPYAQRSAGADFHVNPESGTGGRLLINNNEDLKTGLAITGDYHGAYMYDGSNFYPGRAMISNDTNGDPSWARALMIMGNTSAGGGRLIRLYEDVQVRRNLEVLGTSTLQRAATVQGTLTAGTTTVNGSITATGRVHAGMYWKTCDTTAASSFRCTCDNSDDDPLAGGVECYGVVGGETFTYVVYDMPFLGWRPYGWEGRCYPPTAGHTYPKRIFVLCGRIDTTP